MLQKQPDVEEGAKTRGRDSATRVRPAAAGQLDAQHASEVGGCSCEWAEARTQRAEGNHGMMRSCILWSGRWALPAVECKAGIDVSMRGRDIGHCPAIAEAPCTPNEDMRLSTLRARQLIRTKGRLSDTLCL